MIAIWKKLTGKSVIACVFCTCLAGTAGCGALGTVRTEFPAQFVDSQGQSIPVEDIQAITQDDDLTRDEQIDALRDLGIENEELIIAIVDDGLAN